ncbi:unnamed protein product [Phytophthora fragariaefolia]|uniref:Unnamed protein product n=1 Tax=Phytophthora fragariaefolia TaxID=1490495 RepID=A0A9W7D6P5_9STRA|nr:unnamed protein product [Phytophthora fragariaefolia]
MVKPPKSIRAAKAAKRILQRITTQLEPQPRKRRRRRSAPDAAEAGDTVTRLARHEETKQRNVVAQLQPREIKRKRMGGAIQGGLHESRNKDAASFFAAIDAPFLRICGSCGELTKSEQSVIKTFEPEADRFAPLRNKAGKCEVIAEGVFTDQICGLKKIWLCKRWDKSLRESVVPKFCRASGFRIATVPSELAVLNRMEARLIGLGILFTTCVNLYSDGQEFTRRNSINYWNNAFDVVLDLPRPLSKCGIVYLKTLEAKSTKFFRVRPDLIRRTLCWLIDHNPLYK